MSMVYEDDYGITRCGVCDADIACNEYGDMPDICPKCGRKLNYSNADIAFTFESINGGTNNLCIAIDWATGTRATSTKGRDAAARNLRRRLAREEGRTTA